MKESHLIHELLRGRILILDGATGSMMQRYRLEENDFRGSQFASHEKPLKGNFDVLNITRPDIVQEVHRAYLEVGADLIETNTFSATSIAQEDYGLEAEVYELNRAGAAAAREMADLFTSQTPDKPRFVAGSVGPTNKTLSLSPDVSNPGYRAITFEEMKQAYSEQVKGLLYGGADLILLETVFDTLNVKVALMSCMEVFQEQGKQLPIMVSGTITDTAGRLLSGQTVSAFLNSISHVPLLTVGLNCALGAEQLRPYIEDLAAQSPFGVSAHPNAGLPNAFGEYEQTPEKMVEQITPYLSEGLINIIGGCCGTTPAHIEAIAEEAQYHAPRKPLSRPKQHLIVSGLETLEVSEENNFINIGERTNVAGSKKFLRLIKEGDYTQALTVARDQVENGAQVIDINMDDSLLDGEQAMVDFLKLLSAEPDIARVPIMIDSSKWEIIEAALQHTQGKSIVNSISLKEGEELFLQYARTIRSYGAAVVVMAFDEVGQADTYDRRVRICERSYRLLVDKVGFPPQDIILDPNIFPVGTGMEEHRTNAIDFIEATRWCRQHLPNVNVSGGVSNVSFSFRGNNRVREAIHSAFLYHAIQAGMNMGIVNPALLEVYDDLDKTLLEHVEDVLLNRREDATERLLDYAENIKEGGNASSSSKNDRLAWRDQSVEERLSHAIIKGLEEYVEQDVLEALEKYQTPLRVVEEPLMAGMGKVGTLFGEGKMFLPQVIKSARVMKRSVAVLEPYFEQTKGNTTSSAGKLLIATVKGDVHDIGKNIVNVVLACNNYEMIDLGVMVPSDQIIARAKEARVEAILLSGLITPSLDEMIDVAREMDKAHLNIPLVVGGATTSKLHTAVKIAPAREGRTVAHSPDASHAVPLLNNLLSKQQGDAFRATLSEEYATLRTNYEQQKQVQNYLSIQEAREKRFPFNEAEAAITPPKKTGVQQMDIPIQELILFTDWTPFFHVWDLKGRFPSILEHPKYGEPARELWDEAEKMIKTLLNENALQAKAVCGIFPAQSIGDDIVLSHEGKEYRLFMYRQQRPTQGSSYCFSLSDFIAPQDSGIQDYIGLFCVSSGYGVEEKAQQFRDAGDDFSSIMLKALADRFAESAAEYLHQKVRKEIWGYAVSEDLSQDDLVKEKYQGIRPAPGYPACPSHQEKETLWEILRVAETIGVTLTDSWAMFPTASVSGYLFAHPQSRYFGVGSIQPDQQEDYDQRRAGS